MINGQNVCIHDWFKKGLTLIGDLFDEDGNEDGNIYDFDTLKHIYGLRGTFLDLHSLLMKIPENWKMILILNNNKISCITNRFNVKCNLFVKQIIKDKKGGRRFFDIMIDADKLDIQNK